jgi:YVTN family beta-propeller protein
MVKRKKAMNMKIYLSWLVVALIGFASGQTEAGQVPSPMGSPNLPMLIITNKSGDTISFVDLRTLQVIGTASTGRGPHEVAVAPDGRLAFTANYEGPGDSISVIDTDILKEIRRIPLDPYRRPHGLAMSRDGQMLYVTCEANQAAIEIEAGTGKIRRAFSTQQQITHMLALTPDGRKLYTANILSGTLTAVNLETGEVISQIATGEGCEGIDITPDGKNLWATNREAGTISVLEVETDRVVDSLVCPGFPIRLKFTPDGKMALVTCYLEGSVAFFEVAGRQEVKRIRSGISSPLRRPIGMLVEPDGGRAFVSNSGEDEVLVIDLQHLEVADRIPSGREPDGLAYVPAKSE